MICHDARRIVDGMAIRERSKGHWLVVVYAGKDPVTGKQIQRSRTVHGTKKDAKLAEAALLREVQGDARPSSDITFADLAARWQARNGHEASTAYQTGYMLRRHILPRWGTVPISKIRAEDLSNWMADLVAGGLAPSTVVRVHGVMSAAFGWAMRGGRQWVERNPCELAEKPKQKRAQLNVPDPDTVAAALAMLRASEHPADTDLWVFVRVAAVTGMRRGEVCALRQSDVDVRSMTLRKARAVGLGQSAYLKDTKTGSAGVIALDRHTVAILRWHLWRLRHTANQLGVDLEPDPFLFSWEPDRSVPWRPNLPTQRLRKLTGGTIQLLTLRHFVASNLLAAGVDLKTVAGRLGHARTSTTANVYAQWVPGADRAAADAQGKLLGR